MSVLEESDEDRDPGEVAVARSAPSSLAPPDGPVLRRFRTALEPAALIDKLRGDPEVRVYPEGQFPDLGDLVPSSPFVAEAGNHGFRVVLTHRQDPRGHVQGHGEGGGMLPQLVLHGELTREGGGTRVDLRVIHDRSARSALRWLGFLGMLVAGSAWIVLGSGFLWQRIAVYAVFLAFVSPALILDVVRIFRERRDHLELLALAERIFGPLAVGEGDRSPYRAPRRGLSAGS